MLTWLTTTAAWPRPLRSLRIKLQADEEQEEDDADLAQDVEASDARRGKHRRRGDRQKQPEQARPQHDAGDHLPHHLRLAEQREEHAHDTADDEHQSNLHQQKKHGAVQQPVSVRGLLSGGAFLRRRRRRRILHPRPPNLKTSPRMGWRVAIFGFQVVQQGTAGRGPLAR